MLPHIYTYHTLSVRGTTLNKLKEYSVICLRFFKHKTLFPPVIISHKQKCHLLCIYIYKYSYTSIQRMQWQLLYNYMQLKTSGLVTALRALLHRAITMAKHYMYKKKYSFYLWIITSCLYCEGWLKLQTHFDSD